MRQREPNRLVVRIHDKVARRQVESRDGSADCPKLEHVDVDGCLQRPPKGVSCGLRMKMRTPSRARCVRPEVQAGKSHLERRDVVSNVGIRPEL